MLAFCLFLPLLLAPAAQEVPKNDGWVTDQAGLLTDAQEAELEDLMESYRVGSGHELALLTVKSLEGRSIEDLALDTARAWGVSGKELNDGALLVVASEDKKMRFEVGLGLGDRLTDAICGRIIRDVIAPPFREGRFFEGIRAGIVAAHAAIGGDYGPLERSSRPSAGGAEAVCPLLFALLFVALAVMNRRRGGPGGRSSSGGLFQAMLLASLFQNAGRSSGWSGAGRGGSGGGGGFRGFSGFGGGRGFGGGGASGGW